MTDFAMALINYGLGVLVGFMVARLIYRRKVEVEFIIKEITEK